MFGRIGSCQHRYQRNSEIALRDWYVMHDGEGGGARLSMDAAFGSWGTQTLIAGLRHEALIAPCVIKGPWMILHSRHMSARF